MTKISKHNYEAYFLDYLEGNLLESDRKELMLFLANNPELEKELKEFENIELSTFNQKESSILSEDLKREETTTLVESDYLMIAEVEGVISSKEKEKLSDLINKEPKKVEELAIYHKTKLISEESVSFPNKEALKKRAVIKFNFKRAVYYSGAVAAILLAFFYLNQVDKKYSPTENNIAVNSSLEEDQISLFPNFNKQPIEVEAKKKIKTEKTEKVKSRKTLDIEPMPSSNYIMLANKELEFEPKIAKPKTGEIKSKASNPSIESPKEEEFTPIDQYAKNQFQDKVLNGKSISKNLQDGLAAISDDKINFDIQKSDNNKVQKFAINIGKFGFSRTN